MAEAPRLLVATHNRGKVKELAQLLPGLEIVTLADLGVPDDVVEDGATLPDNARKKARAARARTGMLSLADDSGLEVDALGGAPGVHSARFGGEPRSDGRNIEALFAALRKQPQGAEAPRARFRCCLCLLGDDVEVLCEGAVEGTLLPAPRGQGGFGYDPLFVPLPEELGAAGIGAERRGLSFAELSAEEKNRMSHRGKALRRLLPLLGALLAPPARGT